MPSKCGPAAKHGWHWAKPHAAAKTICGFGVIDALCFASRRPAIRNKTPTRAAEWWVVATYCVSAFSGCERQADGAL